MSQSSINKCTSYIHQVDIKCFVRTNIKQTKVGRTIENGDNSKEIRYVS